MNTNLGLLRAWVTLNKGCGLWKNTGGLKGRARVNEELSDGFKLLGHEYQCQWMHGNTSAILLSHNFIGKSDFDCRKLNKRSCI